MLFSQFAHGGTVTGAHDVSYALPVIIIMVTIAAVFFILSKDDRG